jgi:nitrogen fixation NifU-like protein
MTEPSLTSLYQQLILEHYRNPRNKSELDDHTVEAHVSNPVCGDEIRVQARMHGDTIEDIRFEGQGCSISQASVSMMTALVKGSSRDEAIRIADRFTEMMHGSPEAAGDRSMGDLRALQGVSKFPVRIKCALLGFDALREALREDRGAPASGGHGAAAREGRGAGGGRTLRRREAAY